MVKLYSEEDLWNAVMQRRKLLAIFFSVLVVWLAGFACCIAWYVLLPYKASIGKWVIVITCVWTALFIMFSFPFMGISFKRCNAYVRALKFLSTGIKDYCVAPFEGIDDWTTHDGVDVNVADFSVPNVKRDGMMTRQVYVDGEKDFPPFEEGKRVGFVTQGNLLVEYELIDDAEERETSRKVEENE